MPELMIVASDIAPTVTDHALVVGTPLDAIIRLESQQRITTVVLAGAYARDLELARFLGESYPSICVELEA